MIKNLWSTPIGIFDIGDYFLNLKLLKAMKEGTTLDANSNIWDQNSDVYKELSEKMLVCANEVIKERDIPANLKLGRGWLKCHEEGDINTPHAHSRNLLAGVYYIQANDNCGDLLLQNPNAGTMWNNSIDGISDCRSYIRIKPKAGMLIIFPGHIVHSVEPNKSKSKRICIATNFNEKT